MESGLTYEEIVEILLRQDELLGLYRNQLKELTKEYDADDELIELTQLRSPRLPLLSLEPRSQVLLLILNIL